MTETRPQETLSAQQLQTLQKQFAESIKALGQRMEVRDRALDQACRVVTAASFTQGPIEGRVSFHDPLALAKGMFEFLTADLAAAQAQKAPESA